jgi:hypothetical protein
VKGGDTPSVTVDVSAKPARSKALECPPGDIATNVVSGGIPSLSPLDPELGVILGMSDALLPPMIDAIAPTALAPAFDVLTTAGAPAVAAADASAPPRTAPFVAVAGACCNVDPKLLGSLSEAKVLWPVPTDGTAVVTWLAPVASAMAV